MTLPLVSVVTTIQPPTAALRRLAALTSAVGGTLVVIGDRKGPAQFAVPGTRFLSLTDQQRLPGRLAQLLPTGHYARKNLGYLLALAANTACIYETDDDNAPGPSWQVRPREVPAQTVAGQGWCNVYRLYCDEHVWPRGFPLERLAGDGCRQPATSATLSTVTAPIQQGLANQAPDVDAVWRMTNGRAIDFRDEASVLLPPGIWCPFNSQSTWWRPPAFLLLYLPSHCSFRMTDIWRSFVAQRCLWELGLGVVFHGPEVVQERNPHCPLHDFTDEVPGYLNNQRIANCLAELSLLGGEAALGANLIRCYQALHHLGLVAASELPLVRAWIDDVGELTSDSRPSALDWGF